MSIQGSDYGFSTSDRPMLNKLADDNVIVIRKDDELNRCVEISEACDDYYTSILTGDELRILAMELVEVANIIDPKKHSK